MKSKVPEFRNNIKRISLTTALVAVAAGIMAVIIARADSLAINFENPPYTTGSINGQEGWAGTLGIPINPLIDQAIVANSYGYSSFGGQSWRISNAYTDGAFGDWPFSPSLANEAGETMAQNGLVYSGGTRQCHFEVQWDFASTVPSSLQPDLQISTSPDRGDGARMSFIRMRDLPAGLGVEFVEYQDSAPYGSLANPTIGCGPEDDFVLTTVASGLDRSVPHTIKLTIDFLEGARNDRVKIYVDGKLRQTGGSWEDYYRWCAESGGGIPNDSNADQSRTVDSMIFQARTSGGTAPLTLGNGFLIDNLSYSSSATCSGQASTEKVTGGGQIEGDPVFSVDGMLLSVPALVPSLANPKSQASFGFAVQDGGAPKGNLEYNDKPAGVRVKVTSISGLSFSSSCGPNTHAKFSGMADVIRATGTTSEPFTVDVDDCGEPGTMDTFGIMTLTYSNGPSTLIGGNIQIQK